MERHGSGFDPFAFSDLPLYNTQAASEETGVPAITLRSWERRYGIPRPRRDGKGYRLYSERDIAVTRWLRERVARGIGISRAVGMLRALESTRGTEQPDALFDWSSLRRRLLRDAAEMDEVSVSQIVWEALTVASVEEVALKLIQPVLYEVGERWAEGRLSVTQEHVASNLLRARLLSLTALSPRAFRSERLVVACVPGELHDIGALLLTLFLRRRGFDVLFAGASVRAEDFLEDMTRLRPAAVLLSATVPESAVAARPLITQLSARLDGVVAVGGQAVVGGDRSETAPAVYLGHDAGDAVMALNAALDSRAASRR